MIIISILGFIFLLFVFLFTEIFITDLKIPKFFKSFLFLLLFFPGLTWAYTPEEVAEMGAAKSFIYTTYARCLSYMPNGVSIGLQKRLAIWAHDPNGNSVYGSFNITVDRGNSLIGLSTVWDSSPYVNGAKEACPGTFLGNGKRKC